MLRKKDHAKVGSLLLYGLSALIVGIFALMFGLLGAAVFGSPAIVMAVIGSFLALGGGILALGVLIYGIRQEKGDSRETRVTTLENVQISARFAINRIGETLFDADYVDFDDPKTKLYVRLNRIDAPPIELRTNSSVWMGCGEGMKGRAHVQGDWLGQFEMIAGPPPTGNPYIK